MSLRHKASTPAAPRVVQLPNLTGVGVVMNENGTGHSPYTTSMSKDNTEWRSDIKQILDKFENKAGGVVQLRVNVPGTDELDKLSFSISVGGEPKMVSLVDDVSARLLFQVSFEDRVVIFVNHLEIYIEAQGLTPSDIVFLTFF